MSSEPRNRNHTNTNLEGSANRKGQTMKRTLGIFTVIAVLGILGITTASAETVYWTTDSATATWTNPDSDDFSTAPIGDGSGSAATYDDGDTVQFGNGFSGTLPDFDTAISFTAGGVNPAKIIMYTPRGENRITFNMNEDNALGIGEFTGDYNAITTFNNTKGTGSANETAIGNYFTQTNVYSLIFTGGDFRMSSTFAGGANFRPAENVTVTVDNGVGGSSEFYATPTGTGGIVRINGASTSHLNSANADVTIQVGADNALGPAATDGTNIADVRGNTKLEAVGGPRTLSNNFVSRGMQVTGSEDLTMNGYFYPLGTGWNSLFKTGTATLTIGADHGTRNYGAVNIREGVVRLAHANALGTSAVALSGGVLELGAGDFTNDLYVSPVYYNSAVGWLTSGAYGGSGGFSAYGADRVVNLGGASAQVTWNSGGFVPTGQSLIFGSTQSNAQLDFQNPINLNGAVRTIRVNDNPGSTADQALLSGAITGTGSSGIDKTGDGTLVLSGTNTYAGTTQVTAGTFIINGDHSAATGAVTVDAGASLGGSGTVGGILTISGHHAPGSSAGIQTLASDLSYTGGASSVTWELAANTTTNAANPNANYDTVIVGSNLDFAGGTALNLSFDTTGSSVLWTDALWTAEHLGTDGWLMYDVAGTTTNVSNLSLVTTNWTDSVGNLFENEVAKGQFSLYQDGDDVYLNFALIPEPSTFVILAMAALGLCRRR